MPNNKNSRSNSLNNKFKRLSLKIKSNFYRSKNFRNKLNKVKKSCKQKKTNPIY